MNEQGFFTQSLSFKSQLKSDDYWYRETTTKGEVQTSRAADFLRSKSQKDQNSWLQWLFTYRTTSTKQAAEPVFAVQIPQPVQNNSCARDLIRF